MKNYILIANNVNNLATTTTGKIIGIPLLTIGIIIVLIGLYNLITIWEFQESFLKKLSILFFSLVIMLIGSVFGGLGTLKISVNKNFKSKKVIDYMEKEGVSNIDPEKLIVNVEKVKNFNGIIPITFRHCSRSCYYDYNAYYNELLNNYYNNIKQEEILYQQKEKEKKMSEEIKENSKITVMNNIKKVGIEDTIKNSYLDYSMSVIVSRALPDARDGLKPVHRRILFSMDELGLNSKSQFRKCARIVGDVLGKYHPHGDSSVYGALVRLAQDFNMRYTLVQGHGNFGSIDGDEAAAMRYTESKMAKITEEMLQDINKDTIDYTKNFDESLDEPTVLPAKLPNLLVNGSTGIAVGMATNIPPHNLKEVCNAICATIDNKEISSEELLQHIQGPDFPTGGIINGRQGILEAYTTGKGKLKIRGKVEVETEKNGRETIIITELPYQVNKARLVEKIAKLVREKKIDGIVDLRDESDREGMRIVIKLRKDTPSEIVINQLYKYTELQSTFGIIMLALVNNVPKILTLKELINVYINHRFEVITRRTRFDLQKAEAKIHILNGFLKALDNIDEIIKIIKSAENADIAKEILETKFEFSEIQSKAILDMKLQKLTGLEREKIETEHSNLMTAIENFKKILSNENEVYKIIKTETNELKEKYSDERKTQIVDSIAEIDIEDLIKDEDCVVTITHKQ